MISRLTATISYTFLVTSSQPPFTNSTQITLEPGSRPSLTQPKYNSEVWVPVLGDPQSSLSLLSPQITLLTIRSRVIAGSRDQSFGDWVRILRILNKLFLIHDHSLPVEPAPHSIMNNPHLQLWALRSSLRRWTTRSTSELVPLKKP